MNKRYIDFVPVDRKAAPRAKAAPGKVPSSKAASNKAPASKAPTGEVPVRNGAPKRVAPKKKITRKETNEVPVEEMFEEKPRPAGVSSGEAKFGVIEDYRPMFVKTDVKKRPLGAKEEAKKPALAKPAMVKPTGVKAASGSVSGAASGVSSAAVVSGTVSATKKPVPLKPIRPVKANFINTNKIEKRPLSSVNIKKTAAPTDEEVIKDLGKPEKPVRIITKPEKDSNVGMIIAVILTIILGAAAGTVAFLLLPK